MTKVLITGMSGTGKSTVLRELGKRGHRVVDTDSDDWSHWATVEPLLRQTSSHELDATAPVAERVAQLEAIAAER